MVRKGNGRAKLEKNGLFIVEAFVNRRRTSNGTLEYLVKWKDYPSSHNTWEAASNVAHCREVITEFRDHRAAEGFDDSEYEADFVVKEPPPEVTKPKKKRKTNKQRQAEAAAAAAEAKVAAAAAAKVEEPVASVAEIIEPAPMLASRSTAHLAPTPAYLSPSASTNNVALPEGSEVIEVSADRFIATTLYNNERLFCLLLSDGTKAWFDNFFCRERYPQLLLDYYEACSTIERPNPVVHHVSQHEAAPMPQNNESSNDNPWPLQSHNPSPVDRDESVPPILPPPPLPQQHQQQQHHHNYMGLVGAFAGPPPQHLQQQQQQQLPMQQQHLYPQQQFQQHNMFPPPVPINYGPPQHGPVNPERLFFDHNVENPEMDWFAHDETISPS